jgi:hypothetical protein
VAIENQIVCFPLAKLMATAHQNFGAATAPMQLGEAISPYKAEVWRHLTPRERLRRSWQMRSRLPDLKAVHDRKLFPKP